MSARTSLRGAVVVVHPTWVDAHGDAHTPDSVVIPGAFPGERVRARIVARGRNTSHAELLDVEVAHPDRRSAPCPKHLAHAPRGCAGCPLMELDEPAQRALKADRIRSLGIPIDRVIASPLSLGYRRSAKRVVGGEVGALVLGSRRRRSVEVAPMAGCRVDDARLVAAFDEMASLASAAGLAPWDDASATGLRYVWAKTDGVSVTMTLLGGQDTKASLRALSAQLSSVTTVAWGLQTSTGNAIRGASATVIHHAGVDSDDKSRHEALGLGPLGFLQPNAQVIALAYDDLVREPDGSPLHGELAWDLYAGAGAITTRLRQQFTRTDASELYPESAAALGVEPCDAETFVRTRVESNVAADSDRVIPDLIIANPPRAGLRRAAPWIDRVDAERLHIMSCSPESLARDLEAMPNWQLVAARAYDTLPQTAHVEVVAWLRRKR